LLRPSNIIGDMVIRFFSGFIKTLSFLVLLSLLNACAPASTPTYFVPPTEPATIIPIIASSIPVPDTAVPTLIIPTPTPPCTNNLTFIQDLTIPDGTNVTPGESIDKQWSVSNSGTCNWDARYSLKLINGDPMGAPTEQALYPARAGTKATLRIVFTTPQNTGTYQSAWQAYGPDGSSFGNPVSVLITVGP
jgi:hypothetical protein